MCMYAGGKCGSEVRASVYSTKGENSTRSCGVSLNFKDKNKYIDIRSKWNHGKVDSESLQNSCCPTVNHHHRLSLL